MADEVVPASEWITLDEDGQGFVKASKGKPAKPLPGTITNILAAVTSFGIDDAVALNEADGSIWVRGVLPWRNLTENRPWEPTDNAYLTAHAEDVLHRRLQPAAVRNALTILADHNRFNPVIEAYEQLPRWDGKQRVGTMLASFLGAPGTEYVRAVEQLMFCGCVMRTFQPGCKFDFMPVLVGGQGIGKSTFARKLALRDDFFTDMLGNVESVEASRSLQGNLVVEIAELAALSGKRIEAIKAFISRTSDDYRQLYQDAVLKHPRRCVLVGTTNSDFFLKDSTGNRRFLPVQCDTRKAQLDLFSDEADAIFEQAHAEIFYQYCLTKDLPLVLPDYAQKAALEAQRNAELDDPRVGLIEEWMDSQEPGTKVCATQIAEQVLGVENPPSYLIGDIHSIVKNIGGWQRLDKKARVGSYGVQRAYEKLA